MNWINIKETKKYPPEFELVLLYNEDDGSISLGEYFFLQNEGWFWALARDVYNIHVVDDAITCECEIYDDFEFTHWHPLPKVPNKNKNYDKSMEILGNNSL